MHDLFDHLAGRDRLDHLLADRLLLHLLGEVTHDLQGHVRLEKSTAHLAHGLADVAFGQRAALGELVEYA